MQKIGLKILTLTIVLSLAAPALAIEFGVRGYYWFPGLEGDVKVDNDDIGGTKLDLKSDFAMDEESYPIVEAFAGLGKHHLSLSYYKVDYEGDKDLEKEIVFNGVTYSADQRIVTEFSYSMLDFEYRYDLLNLENFLAGGSISALAKVKYMDGLVSLEAPENDLLEKEEEDFRAPIPMIGAHVHIGLLADLLEFRAQLAGIGYSGALLYEGLADVSLTPFPFLDIHAGYRAFVLDVDADDVELNFNTTGPYIAVSVGF